MPLDPSISLNAQAPDPTQKISSMIGIANAATALKSNQLALQTQQATQQPTIQQAQASAQQAQINAATSQYKLTSDQAGIASQGASSLLSDPTFVAARSFDSSTPPNVVAAASKDMMGKLAQAESLAESKGVPIETVKSMFAPLYIQAGHNPGAVPATLANFLRSNMGATDQANVAQPNGPVLSNGQTQFQTNNSPLNGLPVGQAGPAYQQQIPPTQPVMQGTTPALQGASNQPPTVIPQVTPGSAPPAQQAAPSGPATGLPAGQGAMIQGNAETASADWKSTVDRANAAQQNIPVLATIRQYASGAVTNVGAAQRTLAAGILGMAGISPADAAKTDTDMLAKNSNMLALAGGNTDAARGMAEAANPNVHMSKDAIVAAAREVDAQSQAALFKQKFMGPSTNDPQQYQQKLTEFNNNADFRAFNWASMNVKEKSALKSSMTPAEQQQFRSKLMWMQQNGAIQ